MTLRSSWSVTYSGPHYGVVLKKLERLGELKALDIERERFLVGEEKVEHASFLVLHSVEDWTELLADVLQNARLICPGWRIELEAESVSGSIGDLVNGYQETYAQRVSGLRSVNWEINAAQTYSRQKWLSGQPDQW